MIEAPPPSRIQPRATAWTTYWRTDWARDGYSHLLYQEGAVTVLVPPSVELEIFEALPPVGTPAELWDDIVDGKRAHRLLWFTDDAPFRPYQIVVDRRRWTCVPPPEHYGRVVPLVWYAALGDEGAIARRREEVVLGHVRES